MLSSAPWLQHYSAIMKYISQPPLLLNVHMHNPTVSVRSWMDSLLAFFPGLQVSVPPPSPPRPLYQWCSSPDGCATAIPSSLHLIYRQLVKLLGCVSSTPTGSTRRPEARHRNP